MQLNNYPYVIKKYSKDWIYLYYEDHIEYCNVRLKDILYDNEVDFRDHLYYPTRSRDTKDCYYINLEAYGTEDFNRVIKALYLENALKRVYRKFG